MLRFGVCRIAEYVGTYRRWKKGGRVEDLVAILLVEVIAENDGRYEGSALKSPTASTEEMPILPGSIGLQSSQIQKGVNPVPDFANMFNEVLPPANQEIRPP